MGSEVAGRGLGGLRMTNRNRAGPKPAVNCRRIARRGLVRISQ